MIVPQLIVNSLISGSIYALVASGLSLTYSLLRVLNFAHGHLMMVGAYLFWFGFVMMGWGVGLSALFTIAVSVVVALICLRIFVTPFQKFSYLLTFVTTLALAIILESLISMIFGVSVKSLIPPFSNVSLEFWGIYVTPVQILIIGSAVILLSLLAVVVHSTGIGRRVRALAGHFQAGQALGINKAKMGRWVFVISVLLAVWAGVMIGMETNMQPTMGHSFTIKAFAAMILGGLGSVWGTVVGAFALGGLENFSIGIEIGGWSLPAGWKDAFAFVIILGVLVFRPQGLFGKKMREG